MKRRERIISTTTSLKYITNTGVKPPKLYKNDNRIPPIIKRHLERLK